MSKVYHERRRALSSTAPVSLARVLVAKDDLLDIRKTNDQSVRSNTQCSINKVLIGRVRGRDVRVWLSCDSCNVYAGTR